MNYLGGRAVFILSAWIATTCAIHALGWPHLHAVETCSWVCLLLLAVSGVFVVWASHILAPEKC